MPSPRRFPSPWTVEEQPARFVVRDHTGQQLGPLHRSALVSVETHEQKIA